MNGKLEVYHYLVKEESNLLMYAFTENNIFFSKFTKIISYVPAIKKLRRNSSYINLNYLYTYQAGRGV